MVQAKEALDTAAERCRDQGPPMLYAEALHLLANVELDLGNDVPAQELWQRAIKILRTAGDHLQLAHKIRHLGDLHRNYGRLQAAEESYAEALTLYREHDAPGSLSFANAVGHMAELLELRGDTTRALDAWREASELYSAVDLAEGVEQAQRHIARLVTVSGSISPASEPGSNVPDSKQN